MLHSLSWAVIANRLQRQSSNVTNMTLNDTILGQKVKGQGQVQKHIEGDWVAGVSYALYASSSVLVSFPLSILVWQAYVWWSVT